MSVLYLMRHGQASFGQDNYDQLSQLGHRQSVLAGEYLRRLGLEFDAAFCGTMARQRQTAEAVLAQLARPPELHTLAQFNEYDSGSIVRALAPGIAQADPVVAAALPQMFQDRRSFQVVYEGVMRRWITGRYDCRPAETWREFQGRVNDGLTLVQKDRQGGRQVLLFTSGGPISAVMRRALHLGDEDALQITWMLKNASLSSFFYSGQKISLSTFNSTAHLEEQGEPGLITYR